MCIKQPKITTEEYNVGLAVFFNALLWRLLALLTGLDWMTAKHRV